MAAEHITILVIGVLLSTIGFLIVYVLNGIKSEIGDIKGKLGTIETELHSRVTDLERRHEARVTDVDRRLVHVEATCGVQHGALHQ